MKKRVTLPMVLSCCLVVGPVSSVFGQENSGGLINLALKKPILSEQGSTEGHAPDKITDGNLVTYWEPDVANASVIIDLGKQTKFNRITLYENADYKVPSTIHILGYELSVSNDGKNYTPIDSYKIYNPKTIAGAISINMINQCHSYYNVDCKPQNARYIKFSVTKTKEGTLPQISEIEVSDRPVSEKDQKWSDFINDTSWQKAIDVSAVGRGSLIANANGGTLQLMVTDRPYTNDITDKVTFSIDDPSKATVSPTGLVVAKAPGKVIVTATSQVTGATGTVDIDIMPPDAKYKDSWQSLRDTYKVPEWYTDAKFGLYFHWGGYAVTAKDKEWYTQRMYKGGEDDTRFFLDKFGKYDSLGNEIGYKDSYKYFTADQFNAEEWVKIAKDTGAKFITPVAEHHDGFALYDSSYTKWSSKNLLGRDFIKELQDAAAKEEDMHFGFTNHFKENNVFFNPIEKTVFRDIFNPKFYDFYNNIDSTWNDTMQNRHDQMWYNRATELVDKYHPEFMLFDWLVVGDDYGRDFLDYYYNQAVENNPEGVVMTTKMEIIDGANVRGVERGQAAEIREMPWEANTSISRKSWGYIDNEDYKSSLELVDSMADVVSKNGIFNLNVGPDLHGQIPQAAQVILGEIGDWMRNNGEAIYATKPWCSFGEGPTYVEDGYKVKTTPIFTSDDYRFTQSKDSKKLYVIGMKYPEEEKSKKIMLKTLNKNDFSLENLESIALVNGNIKLPYTQTEEGLMVTLPDTNPDQKVDAYALRLEFKDKVPEIPIVKYKITVKGGTSNYSTAKEGTGIMLNAYPATEGTVFDHWEIESGEISFETAESPYTRVDMPASDIVIKAVYRKESAHDEVALTEKE